MTWSSVIDIVIQERLRIVPTTPDPSPKASLFGRWAGSCEVVVGGNDFLGECPAHLLLVLVDSPPLLGP